MDEYNPEPVDFAERTVRRRQGWLRRTVTTKDTTTVYDRETVRRWIREMHQEGRQSVTVNRPWGSVCVMSAGTPPTGVMVFEPTRFTYAGTPLGMPTPDGMPAAGDAPLTPAEVEQIVLDALTSESLPEWPQWRES